MTKNRSPSKRYSSRPWHTTTERLTYRCYKLSGSFIWPRAFCTASPELRRVHYRNGGVESPRKRRIRKAREPTCQPREVRHDKYHRCSKSISWGAMRKSSYIPGSPRFFIISNASRGCSHHDGLMAAAVVRSLFFDEMSFHTRSLRYRCRRLVFEVPEGVVATAPSGGKGDTPRAVLRASKDPKPTAVNSADITTRGWKPAEKQAFFLRFRV